MWKKGLKQILGPTKFYNISTHPQQTQNEDLLQELSSKLPLKGSTTRSTAKAFHPFDATSGSAHYCRRRRRRILARPWRHTYTNLEGTRFMYIFSQYLHMLNTHISTESSLVAVNGCRVPRLLWKGEYFRLFRVKAPRIWASDMWQDRALLACQGEFKQ